MQFFINASGCKGKISEDIQYPVDHTAIIRRMTEEFDEVNRLESSTQSSFTTS